MLLSLKLEDKKTLFISTKIDKNIHLSSRNLRKANVCDVNSLNTFNILNASNLIIAESSLENIKNLLG